MRFILKIVRKLYLKKLLTNISPKHNVSCPSGWRGRNVCVKTVLKAGLCIRGLQSWNLFLSIQRTFTGMRSPLQESSTPLAIDKLQEDSLYPEKWHWVLYESIMQLYLSEVQEDEGAVISSTLKKFMAYNLLRRRRRRIIFNTDTV